MAFPLGDDEVDVDVISGRLFVGLILVTHGFGEDDEPALPADDRRGALPSDRKIVQVGFVRRGG